MLPSPALRMTLLKTPAPWRSNWTCAIPTGRFTPGSFATVEWPIQRSYPTLFVPATAITTNLQRTFVVRVRQGKTEWVDVTTGVTVNGKTEVFGDVKAGDQVVMRATDELAPGTSVVAHQVETGS